MRVLVVNHGWGGEMEAGDKYARASAPSPIYLAYGGKTLPQWERPRASAARVRAGAVHAQ